MAADARHCVVAMQGVTMCWRCGLDAADLMIIGAHTAISSNQSSTKLPVPSNTPIAPGSASSSFGSKHVRTARTLLVFDHCDLRLFCVACLLTSLCFFVY